MNCLEREIFYVRLYLAPCPGAWSVTEDVYRLFIKEKYMYQTSWNEK